MPLFQTRVAEKSSCRKLGFREMSMPEARFLGKSLSGNLVNSGNTSLSRTDASH